MKKTDISEDIKNDIVRAKQALISTERNKDDLSTSANRIFVACESIVYVFLKFHFGSGSISRKRILTQLQEVNKTAKRVYEETYDLRVQADYGREEILVPLNKENVKKTIDEMGNLLSDVKKKYSF